MVNKSVSIIMETQVVSKRRVAEKDFELLVSLGVFNSALMNDAVYKFKRYEDSSLVYIGINKHEGEDVGLYDTVLSSKDYQDIFENEGK